MPLLPADVAPIIPIRDDLALQVANLTAFINSAGAPPPPPVLSSAWPNKGQTLTDAQGRVYSFGTVPLQDGSSQIWGYKLFADGAAVPIACRQLWTNGSDVFACDGRFNWFKCAGTTLTPVAQPFPALAVSADATVIVPSDPADFSQFLVSPGAHIWQFGPSDQGAANHWVLKDASRYASGNAVKLTIKGGIIYAQASGGQWWVDNGATWSQSGAPF